MRTFLQGNPTVNAIVASVLMLAMLSATYFLFEPMVAHGIADSFTVRQEVSSEIAFQTNPDDVVMAGSLEGITGGTSHGTSTVAIKTNHPTGYNITIQFEDTVAMQGENIGSDIANYTPGTPGTPDYNFSIDANDAEFAFSVNSETDAGDVAALFEHNGSACNEAGSATLGHCWYGASDATAAVEIIDRPNATPGTGATSTVQFRVAIAANPSPAIETGWYNATATLTAVTNP